MSTMSKEYQKEYYQNNKEKIRENSRRYYEKHKDQVNTYKKKYYESHKDTIYQSQQKYIAKNRKKITNQILQHRQRKAKRYKEEGQMYCFLSNIQRKNKMIQRLCRERRISEEQSRRLLEEKNWNIVSLLNSTYEIYDMEDNLVNTLYSKEDIAKYLNCHISTVHDKLRNQKDGRTDKVRDKKNTRWVYIVDINECNKCFK